MSTLWALWMQTFSEVAWPHWRWPGSCCHQGPAQCRRTFRPPLVAWAELHPHPACCPWWWHPRGTQACSWQLDWHLKTTRQPGVAKNQWADVGSPSVNSSKSLSYNGPQVSLPENGDDFHCHEKMVRTSWCSPALHNQHSSFPQGSDSNPRPCPTAAGSQHPLDLLLINLMVNKEKKMINICK